MRSWNYSARWFKKGQDVLLTRDFVGWDQVKLFGKNSQEFKVFRKGTKAQVLDYLGDGGYELQIGEDTIYHIPIYYFEEIKRIEV